MLQEVEELTPTVRKLKINIPSSEVEDEIASAYNNLKARVKIPGFRVGRVPQAMLEKKFGKDIENEVIEKIVSKSYSKAIQEAQILPITYPNIEGNLELIRNHPLSFTATVEVKPDIKNLNYEGIALKEKAFSVEKEEVETAINKLQENNAVLKVSEGPLKEGDVTVIDCDAFINMQEVGELKLKDYPFIIGSQILPEEFSKSLADKKKGENFEIKIKFDESYPDKNIADKEVLFKVSVKEMKEKILPQLDDDFAKGFNLNSVEELKNKVTENIYTGKKIKTDNEYKNQLLDNLISSNNFEAPASMVARELDFLIDEAKQDTMRNGKAIRTDEELRKEYEQIAAKNVRGILLIESIGKKEKIEITEEDTDAAINEIASQYKLKPEEIKKIYIMKDGSLDGIKNGLYSDKVLGLVLSKAVIKKE
jgi:trigger factor